MDGTDRDMRTIPGRNWSVLGLCLAAALLIGWAQSGWAQAPPPDSQQMRPPGIERVQQRIEEIRQAPTRWRQRLGAQLSGGAPAQTPPVAPERSPARRFALPEQRDGPTRADLRRVEERLQALIRELLADRYEGQIPPRIAERFRFVPPAPVSPDTVRVATSVRDTITVADTVRTAPDTVRAVPDTVQRTRVEEIGRAHV